MQLAKQNKIHPISLFLIIKNKVNYLLLKLKSYNVSKNKCRNLNNLDVHNENRNNYINN